jgi:hypothetical protein
MKKNNIFGILLSGSLLLGSFGEVHPMVPVGACIGTSIATWIVGCACGHICCDTEKKRHQPQQPAVQNDVVPNDVAPQLPFIAPPIGTAPYPGYTAPYPSYAAPYLPDYAAHYPPNYAPYLQTPPPVYTAHQLNVYPN